MSDTTSIKIAEHAITWHLNFMSPKAVWIGAPDAVQFGRVSGNHHNSSTASARIAYRSIHDTYLTWNKTQSYRQVMLGMGCTCSTFIKVCCLTDKVEELLRNQRHDADSEIECQDFMFALLNIDGNAARVAMKMHLDPVTL